MPIARFAAALPCLFACLPACSSERAARTDPPPSPPHVEVVDDEASAPPTVDEPERGPLARDPFADVEMALALSVDDGEPEDTLARIPLDRLHVRGVVVQATPLALVEDREGKGHVVRLGDALGDRGGRVRRITQGGVVVEEILRAWNGDVSRVSHVLTVGD